MFTCDTPLASTAGMDGLIEGNVAKAKELLAEAKYDGTPVVMPAADRPRRDQADRAGRQGAAREGGLQGRGPADGLAEHGDPAQHQEGPAVGRRLERLRHELVAARHPRSADDAEPDRDLREGALGLAVRRRDREAARQLRRGRRRRPRRRPRPRPCRSTPCRSSPTCRSANGSASCGGAQQQSSSPTPLAPVTVFWGITKK